MTKILLVEDNEMNKDMLSRRLIKKGYEIVFAMDGQEAIDMAKKEMPDIMGLWRIIEAINVICQGIISNILVQFLEFRSQPGQGSTFRISQPKPSNSQKVLNTIDCFQKVHHQEVRIACWILLAKEMQKYR